MCTENQHFIHHEINFVAKSLGTVLHKGRHVLEVTRAT